MTACLSSEAVWHSAEYAYRKAHLSCLLSSPPQEQREAFLPSSCLLLLQHPLLDPCWPLPDNAWATPVFPLWCPQRSSGCLDHSQTSNPNLDFSLEFHNRHNHLVSPRRHLHSMPQTEITFLPMLIASFLVPAIGKSGHSFPEPQTLLSTLGVLLSFIHILPKFLTLFSLSCLS